MSSTFSVSKDIWAGGQLSLEDLTAFIQDNNIRTVINLRLMEEIEQPDPQVQLLKGLDVQYIYLPTSGQDDIGFEAARKLDALLGVSNGPYFIHCKSSNRVGALLALRAYECLYQDAQQALAIGVSAGLKKHYDQIEAMLRKAS